MESITFEHIQNTTILRCNRPLVLKNYHELMNMLAVLAQRQEMERIMFVFSPQTQIDINGVGILIQLHCLLVGAHKRLYLCSPPSELISLLKELELDTFLRVLTSDEDLLLRLPD